MSNPSLSDETLDARVEEPVELDKIREILIMHKDKRGTKEYDELLSI